MYFLNYSEIYNHRTTMVKQFDRYKDAKEFAENNQVNGYIIKRGDVHNVFKCFVGDFSPTATEQQRLEGIMKS